MTTLYVIQDTTKDDLPTKLARLKARYAAKFGVPLRVAHVSVAEFPEAEDEVDGVRVVATERRPKWSLGGEV